MNTKSFFLSNFNNISQKYSKNVCIYYVNDFKRTLGIGYFELNKISDELSRYFLTIFENRQFVGVSLSDYFLLPCIILGIWKCGCCFAGTGNQYTLKNTIHYLNFLKVKYVISDKADEEYSEVVVSSFCINQQQFFIWGREVVDEGMKVTNHEDICYGIMTSGSTGTAKIIQVPWSCILPNVIELSEIFNVRETDCILQASPCTFDPFFVELFLTLLTGCSLMITSKSIQLSPSSLFEVLFGVNETCEKFPINESFNKEYYKFVLSVQQVQRKNITIIQMTPSVFKRWNDEQLKNILSSTSPLRILILGGEQFPRNILQFKSTDNKTRIYNIYGITEISCWAFLNEVTNQIGASCLSLGKELNDIVYKISENGELHIGSKSRVCLVDNESLFQVDKPVYRNTGDLVELKDGGIFYVGRSNEIFKKYGIKINLNKIAEVFLSSNKLMKECCCVCDESSAKLALVYVPVGTTQLENFAVVTPREFLKKGYEIPIEELKSVEKPDYFLEVDQLPLNSHGKRDRKKLVQYIKNIQTAEKSELDLENSLLEILSDVLSTDKSNLHSKSFIELGGTSILGLNVINKLENVGVKAPPNFIAVLLGGGSFLECLTCLRQTTKTEVPRKKVKTDDVDEDKEERFIEWKFDMGKCVDSTPTVFSYLKSEKVIVGSHSSKLSCLSAESGAEVWTISLGDRIESGFSVFKDGSRGFVGCYNHFVYCVSVSGGEIIWQYKTGEMIKSTPCLSSNEQELYVASYDKYLYILSSMEGQLLKKIKLSDGGIYSSGIVSDILKTFYIGTLDGTCVALDQQMKEIKWKVKLKTPIFASPCLIDNESTILFGEVLGMIHCLNTFDGTIVWRYRAGGNIYSSPTTTRTLDGSIYIIFGCHDSYVYCLQNGKVPELKWKQLADSAVFARPAVIPSEPFSGSWTTCVATTKGSIYFFHFLSGVMKTKMKLKGEIFSSPVYNNKRLFVGCRDNYVYSLNLRMLESS